MFTKTHPEIPTDHYADAHGQLGYQLQAGEHLAKDTTGGFAAYLESIGHTGPWTAEDSAYAKRHAGPGGRSLMSGISAYLYARGLIGKVSEPQQPGGGEYDGKPTYSEVLKRLEGYGFTIATSAYSEQYFFATKYWENKLTPANDAEWMARERGLYWLPETYEVEATTARGLFRSLERAIGEWGLSSVEAQRQAALVAYFAFEGNCVPGPGEGEADAPASGSLVVNPRRVFYAGRKVENQITLGSAWQAAVSCTRVDWLLGVQSVYAQYSMQTYPLSQNDWRASLGLPLVHEGGSGGFGVGGGR